MTDRTAPAVGLRAHGWGWRHAGRLAWAVRDLDLDVAPGERVLLLGASGAGKSTLLAGCAGLLGEPGPRGPDGVAEHDNGGESTGQLTLDGVPAAAARLSGSARAGLLLQDPDAQTVLARCGDDVAFGLENLGVARERIWPRVDEALRSVGFRYGRQHPTSDLSGGERQRLALAGVLAMRPGLLLLDEPTAMLDPQGAQLLRETVRDVLARTGATCVIVEHRVEQWLDVVDRVVVLAPGGGLAADGTPQDVLGRHGASLAAQGVWVPERYLPGTGAGRRPRRPRDPRLDGTTLLSGRGLAAAPAGADVVVRDVDLDLRAGRATALVGPNGAGKTTLAHVMAGLARPSAGALTATAALARGLSGPPHRWRARDLVTRIGTVFQEPQHQFVAATVREELAVGPRRARRSAAQVEGRVDELLTRLHLAHLAQANPFTLSGGEQRRLSVATALATGPSMLVLDEPTFGQDSRTWAELVDLLRELLDDGTGVLAVTHDEALVRALADEVHELPGPLAPSQAVSA
ncbi:ABC transporter ATP-binding protein [Angustibacter sp. McL0619]|uniref:ABC transporter ATP-binding protein n=1 Tax=Angustibacter sp. McL0619 TaxID=3415676 RepID=UPI003CF75B46